MPPKNRGHYREKSPSDKSMCAPNAAGVCIPIVSPNTRTDQQKPRRRSEKSKSRENSLQQNSSFERESSSNNDREDSVRQSLSFEQQVLSGMPPLNAREIPIT